MDWPIFFKVRKFMHFFLSKNHKTHLFNICRNKRYRYCHNLCYKDRFPEEKSPLPTSFLRYDAQNLNTQKKKKKKSKQLNILHSYVLLCHKFRAPYLRKERFYQQSYTYYPENFLNTYSFGCF